MSFFSKISTLFGFGADVDDEIYVDNQHSSHETSKFETNPQNSEDISPDAESAIFDKVIEMFNAALPSFISQSIDPEKQRKLLYDALDQSLKDYLASLRTAANTQCALNWDKERESLMQEAANLKSKANDLESKKAEVQEKQRSAERQKRALADRVRDLEAQVLKLEAEKEQYELESKCMVNRAKASAVLETEIDELRQENEQLKKRLLNNVSTSADDEVKFSETLKAENEKLTAGISDAMSEIEKLTNENTMLKDALDETKVKDKMNDAMVSDLQKKAAEANSVSKDLKVRIDQLEADIKDRDSKISQLETDIANNSQQLADEEETRKQIAEIQKQMELFENVKAKMDAKIEKLRTNLQAAQKENESLRLTIKNNLLDHAQKEKELNAEIEKLKISTGQARPSEIIEDQAMEMPELISDTDWLVATPAKSESMRVAEDPNFGYQPPQRKTRTFDNESQMSLFD